MEHGMTRKQIEQYKERYKPGTRLLLMNMNVVVQHPRVIADLGNGRSGDELIVHPCLRGDLTTDKALIVSEHYFDCDAAVRILFQALIENTVRNEVCKFVRVSTCHRLCRVNPFIHLHRSLIDLSFSIEMAYLLVSLLFPPGQTAAQSLEPYVHSP